MYNNYPICYISGSLKIIIKKPKEVAYDLEYPCYRWQFTIENNQSHKRASFLLYSTDEDWIKNQHTPTKFAVYNALYSFLEKNNPEEKVVKAFNKIFLCQEEILLIKQVILRILEKERIANGNNKFIHLLSR